MTTLHFIDALRAKPKDISKWTWAEIEILFEEAARLAQEKEQAVEQVSEILGIEIRERDNKLARLAQEREQYVQLAADHHTSWEEAEQRAAALAQERDRMREGLEAAKNCIRDWHDMGMGEDAEEAWALYQDSPEMRAITVALAAASPAAPTPQTIGICPACRTVFEMPGEGA